MSVLSTVTSSLPNILNLLQGTWDVQYKIAIRDEESEGALVKLSNTIQSAKDLVSGTEPLVDNFEWKSLDFDSFIELKEVQDTQITQSPMENGSFRSVNKVRKPKTLTVVLAKAGVGYGIEDSLAEVKTLVPKARYVKNPSAEKETGLIDAAKNLVTDVSNVLSGNPVTNRDNPNPVNLPMEFRIVTPFDMISSMNLVKLDYTFKQDTGRNMLLMYLTFQEIIEKSSYVKKTVKNPSNSSNESVGKVNPVG